MPIPFVPAGLAAGLCLAQPALAIWPQFGRALTTAPGDQASPAITADGQGGAIVAWVDARDPIVNLFAQRVLSTGEVDAAWPAGGRMLRTDPQVLADAAEPPVFPVIVSDGARGAIVAWQEARGDATGTDVFAQHVLSSGVVDPAWPADGRALCTAPSNQFDPAIASDGASGAIVTWLEARDGTSHIFAQRVLVSGSVDPAWPVNGVAVCLAPIEQVGPILVADGAGGAIVAWRDARSFQAHNMFAQHVLASGVVDPVWPVDGTALSFSAQDQSRPSIVSDGGGGALVTWQEDLDIFTQHVLASGVLDSAFPARGLPLCDLPSTQQSPVMAGAGTKSIVAWSDLRSGTDADLFAMQVLAATTVDVVETPGSRLVQFGPPRPSPAVGPVTLRFRLPSQAPVQLTIYDASGRRVRQIVTGAHAAAEHVVAWDLRDEAGRSVVAGMYFARLEAAGHVLVQKIAKLK